MVQGHGGAVQAAVPPVGKADGEKTPVHFGHGAPAKHRVFHRGARAGQGVQRHRRDFGGGGRFWPGCFAPDAGGFGGLAFPGGPGFGQVVQHFPGESGGGQCAVKQNQLPPGPGHGHIVQAAVLLIAADILRQRAQGLGLGGQNTVHHVQQNHPVIFQALAAVDGGQGQRGVRRVLVVGYQGAQFLQPGQQPGRGGLPGGQHRQNVQLAGVPAFLGQVGPVPAASPQGIQGSHGGFAVQLLQGFPHVGHTVPQPGPDVGAAHQFHRDGQTAAGAGLAGIQRLLFGDGQTQLVIQPQKPRAVPGVPGKFQQVLHVQHRLVAEKGQFLFGESVGQTLPLAQVDEGQGALVVAEQHGQYFAPVYRLDQPGDLFFPPVQGHHLHRPQGPLDRMQHLGAAVAVAGHKAVGGVHDLGTGAVVLLHQQYPGAGPAFFKFHQGLGVGCPEPVDALVLVAHHKEIAVPPGQQGNDAVLDQRGVLGLVHTVIPEPVLEMGPHRRRSLQNLQGEHHLVVVVHAVVPVQYLLVAAVKARQVGQIGLQGGDALLV